MPSVIPAYNNIGQSDIRYKFTTNNFIIFNARLIFTIFRQAFVKYPNIILVKIELSYSLSFIIIIIKLLNY